MAMIFCKDCKHRKFIDLGGCTGNHCKSNPIPQHDPIHSWKQNEDCTIKNRNNDCAEFEGTRRYKWLKKT